MIRRLIDKIIISIFSWHLKSWNFNVVKVKGWGCFFSGRKRNNEKNSAVSMAIMYRFNL